MPLGGVAVVAENTWAAIKGREALKIDWDDGPNGSYDSPAVSRKSWRRPRAKPGKVVRNDGDVDAALASAAKPRRGRILHPASGPRADGAAGRDRARGQRQLRGLGLHAGAAGDARRPSPSASGMPIEKVDGQRHAARRRLRPQVEAGLRRRGGAAVAGDGRQAGQGHRGPARTTCSTAIYHTVSVERLEAGLDADGKPVAWLHRSVGADASSRSSRPTPKHEAPFELGMGAIDTPFAIPNLRVENPEADGAHPHRLVPLGLQHPARLRDPVLRRPSSPPRPAATPRTICSS